MSAFGSNQRECQLYGSTSIRRATASSTSRRSSISAGLSPPSGTLYSCFDSFHRNAKKLIFGCRCVEDSRESARVFVKPPIFAPLAQHIRSLLTSGYPSMSKAGLGSTTLFVQQSSTINCINSTNENRIFDGRRTAVKGTEHAGAWDENTFSCSIVSRK